MERREEIRLLFTQGVETNGELIFPTLSRLSDDYGVSKGTISNWSRTEDWAGERHEFQREFHQRVKRARVGTLVKRQTQTDDSSFGASIAIISEILKMIRAGNARMIEEGTPTKSAFSPNQLMQMTTALANAQRVAGVSIGNVSEDANFVEREGGETVVHEAFELLEAAFRSERGSVTITKGVAQRSTRQPTDTAG